MSDVWGLDPIASQVILRRGELGLTQKQLADKIGTKNTVISRIESGRNPTSVRTLQRIAEALDLELVVGFKRKPSSSKHQKAAA